MNDQIEKRAVLVVDDTPANIQILMETLKDDYRIIAAVNGKRALQLAASSRYHPAGCNDARNGWI